MKSKLLVAVITLFIFNEGYSQFAFSVSPGLSMNRASFGFKMNRVVPFIGIQYYNTSVHYQYDHEQPDYTLNTVVQHNHDDVYKASLIMPNIGIKYFIKESGNLKAHMTLNVCKPLVTAKMVNDGDVDQDVKDYVKGLSLWGGEFSFGVEYFFDEHFSLGGEFGIRYMRVHFKDDYNTTVYNPATGIDQPSVSTYDMKFNASPTFSKISLNFYF